MVAPGVAETFDQLLLKPLHYCRSIPTLALKIDLLGKPLPLNQKFQLWAHVGAMILNDYNVVPFY